MPLNGRLLDLLDEIDDALGAEPTKPFPWEFAAECLNRVYDGQSVDKRATRPTVIRLLSELSESGLTVKSGRNQWTRVCPELSKNVQKDSG